MRRLHFIILGLSLALPLFPCQLQAASTLTLGTISQSPKNEIKKYDPLISYIALNLQDPYRMTGKTRVEKNIGAMLHALRERKIDLFVGEPFVSSLLQRAGDLRFMLQIPLLGTEKHASLIIVGKDSAIKSLADLKGKTLAFDDPLSSLGYLQPKIFLMEKGYKLAYRKPSAPARADEINYVFSGAPENTLLWIKKGKADAGAIDSEIFRTQPKELIQSYKTLDRSSALPPLLISYRSNLSPELVEQIKTILKRMHQSENGKKILEDLGAVPKFQDISKSTLDFLGKKQEFLLKEVKY